MLPFVIPNAVEHGKIKCPCPFNFLKHSVQRAIKSTGLMTVYSEIKWYGIRFMNNKPHTCSDLKTHHDMNTDGNEKTDM